MGRSILCRWIRRRWHPCYSVILMSTVLNIIIYSIMSTLHPLYHLHLTEDSNRQQRVAAIHDLQPSNIQLKQGITVIVREYEDFANSVLTTLSNIRLALPNAAILLVSDDVPYPSINLPSYVKHVVLHSEPFWKSNTTDIAHYVTTEHVMFWPDGVGLVSPLYVSDIHQQMNSLSSSSDDNRRVVAWSGNSAVTPHCMKLDFDVKRWTLDYKISYNHVCHAAHTGNNSNVVILMRTADLFILPYAMWRPVKEALFIQTTLQKWTVDVKTTSIFTQHLMLDDHQIWKQNIKNDYRLKKLYKMFSVKLVRTHSDRLHKIKGGESWYGCSRSTPRCFTTIINDTPEYLVDNRWTPPCCLKNLAIVALHVIEVLESQGVRYWLEGGSLLGAARSGEIIPWDYDVDMGMYKEDLLKCSHIVKASSESYQDPEGFIWERSHSDEGEFYRVQFSMTNHLHVDIFPFYVNSKGMMTKDSWSNHRQDMEFPEHYLNPMGEIDFLGRKVAAPNNYRDFLELKFGKGAIEHPVYPNATKI